MPYRRAHLAVWLLIGLTLVAFWPGYLSRLGGSAWQHHFHALTALTHRRNPALHGGYLLATPLPLIMAVVTRLPLGLVAKETPLPAAFHPGFNLAMAITLACVVALWRWQPHRPAPFIAIGAATVAEWFGYYLVPSLRGWAAAGVAVAEAPTWLVGGIGFGMGAAAMWLGWKSAHRSRAAARAVA